MYDKDAVIPKILEALLAGAAEVSAAQSAGIDYSTLYRWKREVPGFADRVRRTKQSRIVLVEDALYKAALKGDWRAALAYLEKHDQFWRDRAKELAPRQNTLVVGGSAASFIEMLSPIQREKLCLALRSAGLLSVAG